MGNTKVDDRWTNGYAFAYAYELQLDSVFYSLQANLADSSFTQLKKEIKVLSEGRG